MAETEIVEMAIRRRRWYRRRDIRFLFLVGVALALFLGQGYVSGPSRITRELASVLDQGKGRVNIVVTAKFPAEEFHMGIYQDVGAIRGNQGRTTTLFAVKLADVRALSRHYWIDKISLAP